MKNYKVKSPLTVVADRIRLRCDQAAARAHLLDKAKGKGSKDVYIPKGPLSFKAGEIIGLADVTKIVVEKLEPLSEEETVDQPVQTEEQVGQTDAQAPESGQVEGE
jgi:hypothetical protein